MTNITQVKEMTHEEKVAMYMAVDKLQLIEMLIQCHKVMATSIKPRVYFKKI